MTGFISVYNTHCAFACGDRTITCSLLCFCHELFARALEGHVSSVELLFQSVGSATTVFGSGKHVQDCSVKRTFCKYMGRNGIHVGSIQITAGVHNI